ELGSFAVFYHEHRLPIDPQTYPRIIDRVLAAGYNGELASLRRGFMALPGRSDPTDQQIAERDQAQETLKRRLSPSCNADPPLAEAMAHGLHGFACTSGDSESFDSLHELLEAQSYRLASWRVAPDEINYRRFFAVNDLAGLRVENWTVFENTHRLLL